MQVPHPGVSSEELLRRAVLDPTALGQDHGPQEDTVTDTSAQDPDHEFDDRYKWGNAALFSMLFLGMVIGGVATWGVVYYRDWWFSGELMTTRAFLVPVSIVVGFILFLILVKIPMALMRRSRRKAAKHRETEQQLAEAVSFIQQLQDGTVTIPVSTGVSSLPDPPATVRVVPERDPALIGPRAVPRSAPARPRVGDTRPAPPLRTLADLDAGDVVEDDDGLDVPSFVK